MQFQFFFGVLASFPRTLVPTFLFVLLCRQQNNWSECGIRPSDSSIDYTRNRLTVTFCYCIYKQSLKWIELSDLNVTLSTLALRHSIDPLFLFMFGYWHSLINETSLSGTTLSPCYERYSFTLTCDASVERRIAQQNWTLLPNTIQWT